MAVEVAGRASVVIPVHDAEATIADQLRALAEQKGVGDFEVVVVLNRCSDRSEAVVDQFHNELPLLVIKADDAASAAYARNAGATASTGSKLLFCDADDKVGPAWVASMAAELDRVDFCAGVPWVEAEGLDDWAKRKFYNMDGRALLLYDQRVYFPLSASFGVRRDAFEAVGGFDETFGGAAFEDVELAIRLYQRGSRVGVATGATFSYRPRTTLRGQLRQQRSYLRAGYRYMQVDGTPGPEELTYRQLAKRLLWLFAHQVLRQHKVQLDWLVAEAAVALDRKWAAAALDRTRGPIDPDPPTEFVVPIEVPLIGGLGLKGIRSAAQRHATGHTAALLTVAVFDAWLRPSDDVVDIGADIGLASIAAAIRVGGKGSVLAYDTGPTLGVMLRENVQRHGVPIEILEWSAAGRRATSSGAPVAALRIDSSLAARDVGAVAQRVSNLDWRLIVIEVGAATKEDVHASHELLHSLSADGSPVRFMGARGAAAGRLRLDAEPHPLSEGWSGVVVLSRLEALDDLDRVIAEVSAHAQHAVRL